MTQSYKLLSVEIRLATGVAGVKEKGSH